MRRKVLLSGAIVVVILGGFGLYWFQPWKLFTSSRIDETAPAGATTVASGTLITHEHATSGRAELMSLPDGRHQLVLRDLATSDGPDLRIWLTDQPVVDGQAGWSLFDDGKWVELGRLKATHGTQVYDVPRGTDVVQFTSVTIWCRRFAVSFGAADLSQK
ncbi:DM13 domain-containing protein [Allorhizocola rhizosphaerae]|uniref:DM13 domain-containing protein n=1 Tax=Allorhizocola rhizosphaerae TaxID=1872709 RepID=UPI000E3B90B1|nr:DM13 domain-containing protein [Allorhizocola rhizosphaerae]